MTKTKYDIDNENQWCPGCGNFSILKAMKQAFTKLKLDPDNLLIVSGIGQAGKTPNYLACNMLHGLHGRALCLATGAKIANHNLNIVVTTGDGDCYGEGQNHFTAAIRRNIDITLFVFNNQIYGLTKGQASPTSAFGMKTKIQQNGTVSSSFNPLATALVNGAGFIARGFSGNIEKLSSTMVDAMKYKGFSMIDICQPCISFNKLNTYSWYKERVFDLENNGHDNSDYKKALEIVHQNEEKIPTGIIYKKPGIPFHERLPVLRKQPLSSYVFPESELKNILGRA
ncbi:MAG: 2-oxoacid ferredoxin oxidoreductase [Desulfobacteraceae bacterium]|nr:2-oxoacid ferredoxin oxidoreductase [Desulfobacteraceae bacterium]